MKKIRESNFELLRCILMFMVVLVHYNSDIMGKAFLYVTPGTINYYFVQLMESLAIIGTNGFVLLSGYFSWKTEKMSLRKPVGLLIYVAAYNILFCLLDVVLLQQPFSLSTLLYNFIPRNWYISLYVAVMLLCPYINMLIKSLDKKALLTLITVMFVMFSVWSTILDIASGRFGIAVSGMSTVSMSGAIGGYSIVNFVMLYLIGAALSKYELLMHHVKWDVLAYGVFSVLILGQQTFLCAGWNYSNPFVIGSCIAFFNIFRKLHFTSKAVNQLAKASLGVFLIHTQFLVCNWGWNHWNIAAACQSHVIKLGLHMMLCCVVTYLFCSLFDMACRWITKPVSKLLDKCSILSMPIISVKENEEVK